MKIGASTYSLSKAIKAGTLDVWGVFDWLAENDADHIEIVPLTALDFTVTVDIAEAIAQKADEVGLEVSCYTFGASFIDRTEAEYAAELQRVCAEIDNAARMGTKLVRHDVASRPAEQATDEQFLRVVSIAYSAMLSGADDTLKT